MDCVISMKTTVVPVPLKSFDLSCGFGPPYRIKIVLRPGVWFNSPQCVITYRLFTSTSLSMKCPTTSCDDSKAKWRWTKGTKTFANKSAQVCTQKHSHRKQLWHLRPQACFVLGERLSVLPSFGGLGNTLNPDIWAWFRCLVLGAFEIWFVHRCRRTAEPTQNAHMSALTFG